MRKKQRLIICSGLILLLALFLFFFLLYPQKNDKKDQKKEEKITLNGETVVFKKYRINKQFYLEVPEVFVEMSDEEVNKRYTNDFKPGLIFTNDAMDINLLVHASNDHLTMDTMPTFIEDYKKTLQGANITKEELKKDGSMARLDYIIQNDVTEESHHVIFFPILEKAIMIDFKYPSKDREDWDQICEYTFNSIEKIK